MTLKPCVGGLVACAMKAFIRIGILLASCSVVGCSLTSDEQYRPDVPEPYDGFISVKVNGASRQALVFANYDVKGDEVVIWGWLEGSDRSLMLRFSGLADGDVVLDKERTGFWDLGVCFPMRRYVFEEGDESFLEVEHYRRSTGELRGHFEMAVRNEEAPFDRIAFDQGRIETRLRNERYQCIEG